MRQEGRKFLVDSNVLIAAYRSYYAFDLCPGFWTSLKEGFSLRRIFSIHRVKAELDQGQDALTGWINAELDKEFFLADSLGSIATLYAPIMAWVSSKDFLPAAKARFAADADGWLVAVAKHAGYWLVTNEARHDNAKARVMIPNLCEEFGVSYCNTFDMLRELDCSYR